MTDLLYSSRAAAVVEIEDLGFGELCRTSGTDLEKRNPFLTRSKQEEKTMSYDLCLLPQAKKPYYIENIRTNIYSLEELCFYLYNNACLIDEIADE